MADPASTAPAPLDDWFRRIGAQLSDADYEDGIAAMEQAAAALRGQLAAQVEALAPDLTEWRSDYRDGRAHMAIEAAHIVRGGEWL